MSAVTLTDESLIADLRQNGMVGAISPTFLAGYRADRQFVAMVEKIEQTPGGPDKLRRALIQCGILLSAEPDDAHLLAGWARAVAALKQLEANGADATDEVDAPARAQLEAATDVILVAPAVTIQGALVKLRRALLSEAVTPSIEAAIRDGNDEVLFASWDTFDMTGRLIVDAVAALGVARAAAAPPQDRSEWDAAEAEIARLTAAIDAAVLDEEVDPLADQLAGAERHLVNLTPHSVRDAVRQIEVAVKDGPLAGVDIDAVIERAKMMAEKAHG